MASTYSMNSDLMASMMASAPRGGGGGGRVIGEGNPALRHACPICNQVHNPPDGWSLSSGPTQDPFQQSPGGADIMVSSRGDTKGAFAHPCPVCGKNHNPPQGWSPPGFGAEVR